MSLPVRALLSLWNDIAPERVAEYDRWHSLEHVPERVWVPGFVAGTRYVASQGVGPRYFTLYELEQLDCLRSAAYQDLVERPTPWSESMRPSFANFLRKAGPVLAATGVVQGEGLSISRLVWPLGKAPPAASWPAVAQELLAGQFKGFATRMRIQQVQPTGPQALRNVDAAPAGDEVLVLLEQAGGVTPVETGALVLAAVRAQGQPAPLWHDTTTYRFASQVRHEDVAATIRPTPRLDLMPR
jgi:hypothetical protein